MLWTLGALGAEDRRLVGAGLALKETAFLNWAPTASSGGNAIRRAIVIAIRCAIGARRGQMGNVFRQWMLTTDSRNAALTGFAGFRKGIVTRVEVFSFLSRVN